MLTGDQDCFYTGYEHSECNHADAHSTRPLYEFYDKATGRDRPGLFDAVAVMNVEMQDRSLPFVQAHVGSQRRVREVERL